MKHFPLALALGSLTLAAVLPVFAENLLEVVDEAQNTIIRKYSSESSIARKLALKELEEIASAIREWESVLPDDARAAHVANLRRLHSRKAGQ